MAFDNFDLEHWWKASVAAGAALAVGAAAIGNNALILVGVGLVLFGLGEWINRPRQESIYMGYGMKGTITKFPWSPTVFGVLLDIVGIGLLLLGIWRLVFPAAP